MSEKNNNPKTGSQNNNIKERIEGNKTYQPTIQIDTPPPQERRPSSNQKE